jgi:uncharacterized membrane protein
LAPIAFISCLQQSPKIIIKNKTSVTFDSIKVYSNNENPTLFFDVSPKTVMNGKIQFDAKDASDGAYLIEIYNHGKNWKTQTLVIIQMELQ